MTNAHIDKANVSRETFERVDAVIELHRSQLDQYLDRLLFWNRKVNLVSRTASRDLLTEHIRHCLFPALLPGPGSVSTIVDAGTGGGLPGIPLAIVMPGTRFILVDKSRKKMMALDRIVTEMGLPNITVVADTIANIANYAPSGALIVSKHAFKIPVLLKSLGTYSWQSIVMLKGKDFLDELDTGSVSLSVRYYPLDEGTDLSFYEGKVMLELTN